jgi:hypothetical protein
MVGVRCCNGEFVEIKLVLREVERFDNSITNILVGILRNFDPVVCGEILRKGVERRN